MLLQNDSKNDRLDVERLARIARLDPKLLYPIVHRERSARADLAVMRSRDALIATRTKLINHIHGVLKSFGHRVKKYGARGFHRQVEDQIPAELNSAIQPVLDMLAAIAEQVLVFDREIRRMSKKEYPETALLEQVVGVGQLTALCYVLTIEDPARIKRSRNVGAYLGLRPKLSSLESAIQNYASQKLETVISGACRSNVRSTSLGRLARTLISDAGVTISRTEGGRRRKRKL